MSPMSPVTLPAQIRANDEQISAALRVSEMSDSRLAAALAECWVKKYYRVFGYKDITTYMRERWSGTAYGGTAALRARSVQRLIREYRLAQEIPLFKANFDQITRTNRRLLAQVITRENAEEWVKAAVELDAAELERKIHNQPAPPQGPKGQRLYLSIFPETRALWERAKAAARKEVAKAGRDPDQLLDALVLEMVCAEFLATYERTDADELTELEAQVGLPAEEQGGSDGAAASGTVCVGSDGGIDPGPGRGGTYPALGGDERGMGERPGLGADAAAAG